MILLLHVIHYFLIQDAVQRLLLALLEGKVQLATTNDGILNSNRNLQWKTLIQECKWKRIKVICEVYWVVS